MRMDELYQMHAKALQAANLVPNIFPTLGEILDNQKTDPTNYRWRESEKEQQRYNKNCTILPRNE